jgi:ADP-dependent NAD(P)H-hydrate dehydratase / NAD(P)H-hydrate epimerase
MRRTHGFGRVAISEFSNMPAPVISVAQMREWEQASWAAGRSQAEVIWRVGQTLARRARSMAKSGDTVLVLAGKGHNGDDARAACEHLPKDWRVVLRNVTDPVKELAEADAWLEKRPALIVDGLFGIGLDRPLDEHWAALINRVNELQTQVLSVDVPSGLNADTGGAEGAAIRASVTLTLGAPKRGMLLPEAGPHVGRLEVTPDIGLIPCPLASELNWTLPGDFDDYPPARPVAGHKGTFGRLAIIAGSMGYHGSAVLASRGAQRAQPGLITLYTQEAVYPAVAAQLQAVMSGVWRPNLGLADGFNAILIGPGLAAADLPEILKTITRQLWEHAPVPMVVDASALAWLPQTPAAPNNLLRVVTPHPGEAARLLGTTTEQVQANRVDSLREISQRLGGCWVVLKGSQTLIGRSTGTLLVNSSGNPQLAQGGSGDLLAGYVAGLLAQPALQADPLKAVGYAVWQHGAAADRLSATQPNWVVEELAAELGRRAVEAG